MTCKYVLENKENLIGKHGQFMWTGMHVGGVITKIVENEFSVDVYYDMDEPNVWGNETYHHDTVWARKADDFGPLSKSFIDEAV